MLESGKLENPRISRVSYGFIMLTSYCGKPQTLEPFPWYHQKWVVFHPSPYGTDSPMAAPPRVLSGIKFLGSPGSHTTRLFGPKKSHQNPQKSCKIQMCLKKGSNNSTCSLYSSGVDLHPSERWFHNDPPPDVKRQLLRAEPAPPAAVAESPKPAVHPLWSVPAHSWRHQFEYGGFHRAMGGTSSSLDGLFHGKSYFQWMMWGSFQFRRPPCSCLCCVSFNCH